MAGGGGGGGGEGPELLFQENTYVLITFLKSGKKY